MDEREARWAELMVLAQAGDATAYSDLLTALSEALKSYFQRMTGNSAQADDLVQETLISVHKGRHTYLPDRPFGAWLYSIARNRLIDHVRSSKRRAAHVADFDELAQQVAAPEQIGGAEEVRKAFAQLPEKQRVVLALLKFQGLSIKTIAAQLGLSESDVKVTAHRAQKALRGYLE